jgi:hypothetical protein
VGNRAVQLFTPAATLPLANGEPLVNGGPLAIYAWPYGPLAFVDDLVGRRIERQGDERETVVRVEAGSLARGDLEQTAYSLYTRYALQQADVPPSMPLANFAGQFLLRAAEVNVIDEQTVQVELQWQLGAPLPAEQPLPIAYVHVAGSSGLLAQSDVTIASGLWPAGWWRPGLVVVEQRRLNLPEPFDPRQHDIRAGLYHPQTLERLPRSDHPAADEVEIERIGP